MPPLIVTRFAPSPTGLLHLGHAFSAILNHDIARKAGGQFVLRIEDIDQGRARPEFEEAIFRDLEWLGITWDGPVWRQAERMGLYEDARTSLSDRRLVYRCFKTRTELSALASAPHGPEDSVRRTAPLSRDEENKLLSEDRSYAWRLDVPRAAALIGSATLPVRIMGEDDRVRTEEIRIDDLEDPVLARKDFATSYHLSSVLDDHAQNISLVWRGTDLLDALPVHRLLQELLGLDAPTYRHHRLIVGPDGKRLAKRDRAQTLAAQREAGASPDAIRQQLGLLPAC